MPNLSEWDWMIINKTSICLGISIISPDTIYIYICGVSTKARNKHFFLDQSLDQSTYIAIAECGDKMVSFLFQCG